MGSSSKKRAKQNYKSESDDGSYQIKFMENVTKSTTYMPLPDQMTLTPAPTSSKNHWFSFDAKHYHPFGLYDNQNNLIIRSDVQMELTISINANENDKNAFKDSHTTPPVGLIKSSYWFQAIKPHTAGSYRLEVRCADSSKGIPSFIHDITVDSSSEIEGVELKEESNKDKKKRKEITEVEGKKDHETHKKKKSKEPIKLTSLPDMIDGEELETATCPNFSNLQNLKSRLERPLFHSDATTSLDNGSKSVKYGLFVEDFYLAIPIPKSLLIALLDDGTRIKSCYHYLQQFPSPIDAEIIKNVCKYRNTAPSVHEIFNKMQAKCGVSDNGPTFTLLRQAFEYYFENGILYSEEKEWFQSIIKELRDNRIPFCIEFSAIFLLRFIILIITCVNPTVKRDDELIVGTDDKDAGKINADDSRDRQSRRNNIILNQCKQASYKLQPILKHMLKDLDEGAHYYF